MAEPKPDVSLLFDLFVASNSVRRLVEQALSEAPLRADEYAVYSLLFDHGPRTASEMARSMGMPLTTVLDHLRVMDARGHLRRQPHPRDGRATRVSLTLDGVTAHRLTHAAWNPMQAQLEASLPLPAAEVRRALRAIADAAAAGLEAGTGTRAAG